MSLESPGVDVGAVVYTEEGAELGTVRGFDTDGFLMTIREGVASPSVEHERSGGNFGEAKFVWRCSDCGEMDQLDDIPDTYPSCGAPKEDRYYRIED